MRLENQVDYLKESVLVELGSIPKQRAVSEWDLKVRWTISRRVSWLNWEVFQNNVQYLNETWKSGGLSQGECLGCTANYSKTTYSIWMRLENQVDCLKESVLVELGSIPKQRAVSEWDLKIRWTVSRRVSWLNWEVFQNNVQYLNETWKSGGLSQGECLGWTTNYSKTTNSIWMRLENQVDCLKESVLVELRIILKQRTVSEWDLKIRWTISRRVSWLNCELF